jgi:hypothetical protein
MTLLELVMERRNIGSTHNCQVCQHVSSAQGVLRLKCTFASNCCHGFVDLLSCDESLKWHWRAMKEKSTLWLVIVEQDLMNAKRWLAVV